MDGLNRVVLWDFDGTLARREGMWGSCLLTALSEAAPSHTVTHDLIRPGLQSGFPWHRPEEPHLALCASGEVWWQELMPVIVRAYKRAGVASDLAATAAALVPTTYTDAQHWEVFLDTRQVLASLRAEGWRHIVLSNHVPELPDLVVALGLADLSDAVITSASTGYEKPHPAMYMHARELAGQPDVLWMVGDNPVADVEGARRVGIPALLVRDTDEHALPWAAAQIRAEGYRT